MNRAARIETAVRARSAPIELVIPLGW